MLDLFKEKELLKSPQKQRTDSTHILAAIRVLGRLENIGETLRYALNSITAVAPDWLRKIVPDDDWYSRGSVRDFKKVVSQLPKKSAWKWLS